MGIQDRDYMKRSPNDDGRNPSTSGIKLDAFLSGFLQRHPRFFVYVGLGLLVLIIVAVVMARLSSHGP